MARRILVKLFKKDNRQYVVDVGSNRIFEIGEILADVIRRYNYSNRSEVIKNLQHKYKDSDILDTINIIDELHREEGGFILEDNLKMSFPFSRKEYASLLDTYLNHVVLNVSDECNMRCKYCIYSGIYKHSRVHQPRFMSLETMKTAVDFFVKHSKAAVVNKKQPMSLGFYGGEPLLKADNIFKTVRYLKNKYPVAAEKIKFALTTNGTLLSKDVCKQLIEYDFFIHVSLDGPKDVHDRYRVFRNGKPTYDTIIDNLEKIKSIDENYYLNNIGFASVTAPQYKLADTINYFRRNYAHKNAPARDYIFAPVDLNYTDFFSGFDLEAEGKEYKKDNELFEKEYMQNKISGKKDGFIDAMYDPGYFDLHKRFLFPIPDEIYPNGICSPGIKKLFIDCDGNFHMCEKTNGNFSLGNLESGFDIDKIFSYIDAYINVSQECKKCWAVRFCKECFLTAIDGDSFSKEKKDYLCKATKRTLLTRIKNYIRVMERFDRAFDKFTYIPQEDITNDMLDFLKNDDGTQGNGKFTIE